MILLYNKFYYIENFQFRFWKLSDTCGLLGNYLALGCGPSQFCGNKISYSENKTVVQKK